MTEKTYHVNRRDFLKISGVTGAGLFVGIYLGGCTTEEQVPSVTAITQPDQATDQQTPEETATQQVYEQVQPDFSWNPSLWVQLFGDGRIEITNRRSEMGQGIRTALAMVLAEELGADWEKVRVIQAPGHPDYGNQHTGGSQSIPGSYSLMRVAGALVRTHLENIAASLWGLEDANLETVDGVVYLNGSDQSLTFEQLYAHVEELDFPGMNDLVYKDPADYTLVGKEIPRVDLENMLTGKAVYGMDVQIPDMKYAVMVRPRVIGAWVKSYDESAASEIDGVLDIYKFNDQKIAIVAESSWAAIQAKAAIEVDWGYPSELETDLVAKAAALAETIAQPKHSADRIDEIYHTAYLPHLPMEPMNCTVVFADGKCEIWVPSQAPQDVRTTAASAAGIPADDVTVHVSLIGGGFGRRLSSDYVDEAVRVAKESGYAVKLFWTREDDILEDHFHPMYVIGVSGDPNNITFPDIDKRSVSTRLPTGAWRAVQNNENAFVQESFLDELAHAAGRDPYEVRQELLRGRELDALNAVADAAGWHEELPEGWGKGIASWSTWGTTKVAVVAYVSVSSGFVTLQKITASVDCGMVINRDIVRAQVESGIIFALSAVMNPSISIKDGMIEQTNFHNLPIMRFKDAPEIETVIIDSEETPSGLGEMSGPPAIAAVYNAIFDATGIRLRTLPLKREDLLGE